MHSPNEALAEASISARNVTFRFGERSVLTGVGLGTRAGEVTGLIGPNGSGKSTLLRCLYGALRPAGGTVLLDDMDVASYSARDVARRVAVVSQEGSASLGMTVAESILLGRSPHRRDHQSYSIDDRQLVADALDRVGAIGLAGRKVGELSGGERQRVLIARCLAQAAPVVLLDEPTNHLDVRYQHDVLALVRSLGITSVIVLHDLNLAARYCDRLALLHEGVVVAEGTVDEVLQPEILEPVYGIAVRRIEVGNREVVLAFGRC